MSYELLAPKSQTDLVKAKKYIWDAIITLTMLKIQEIKDGIDPVDERMLRISEISNALRGASHMIDTLYKGEHRG